MIQLSNTARLGGNLFQQGRWSYLPGSLREAHWWRPMFDAISPSDPTDSLCPIGSPEVRWGNPSDNDLQRAEGSGRMILSGSEKGTRIVDVFQHSPIRIMFP